jgi:hypothetical protein
MDKPYLLRPWEILDLTDRQIVDLYYRKRDDKGVPVEIPNEEHEWYLRKKPMTMEDMMLQKYLSFMKMGSMIGASPKQMQQDWINKYGKIPVKNVQ